MPSQADYTGPEASLVPEGLRAYRHFTAFPVGFDGHPLHLTPTTYQLRPMAQGGIYLPQYGPYEAECRRGSLDVPESHNAPDPRCKCGFYASYDPDTDFYPDNFWGKTDTATSEGAFTARTVVEMSGRTVMGSKGVRAEKMKVVAVAVDWGKFVWYDGDGISYSDGWVLDWEPSYASRILAPHLRRTPDPEELAEYEALASSLAAAYGARYFSSVADMYEAFPAPDIEHLKPKPEPPPSVEGTSFAGWVTQAQLYATVDRIHDAFADVRKAFAKLQDATVTVSGTFDDYPFVKDETARERALRLKRDPKRKGPASGKGIDYRK